jgi:Beta-galactosidase trimerisation domain/Polysaccharide deacetylase
MTSAIVLARRFFGTLLAFILGAIVFTTQAWANPGQIYLLKSDSTKNFFTTAGADYTKFTEPWKNFAERQSVNLKEISVTALGQLKRNDVLVLPSVVLLSEAEKNGIEKFTASGGALVATWASGSRDAAGAWLGYGWLKKAIGIDVVADIRETSEERFLLPYGESVISGQIPAVKRMFLAKTSEPLLRAKARYPVARFGDWTRQSHGPNATAAAIAVDEVNGARRAWIGAPETTWSSVQTDMDKVLLNLFKWLQRKPTAVMAAWPAPYQSAFFIEMDTEDKFENAATLEKLFADRGLRGTFYMLTSVAKLHKDLVKRIASKHAVGYHADVHDGFKGQSAALQESRIVKMEFELRTLIGESDKERSKRSIGFRAPLESYDTNTEILLRARGVRHHTADPGSSESALPTFSKAEPGIAPEQALVVLPRTLLDDINFSSMGLMAAPTVRAIFSEALKDKLAMRGMGLLSVHSQYLAPGGLLDRELPFLMDEGVRLKDVLWMPSGDQIDIWWRLRERVQVESTLMPNGQLKLKVANTGPFEVNNAQIVIALPAINAQPKLLSKTAAATLLKQDDFRWSLAIASLAPGAVAQWTIGF